MKNIAALLIFLPGFFAYSQSTSFYYQPDRTPVISSQNLAQATTIGEIMPDFDQNFLTEYRQRIKLDDLLQGHSYPPGYLMYPKNNSKRPSYSYTTYRQIIDFVSVSVTAYNSGKANVETASGEQLTAAQKKILAAAEPGSFITVKLSYVYRHLQNSDTAHGEYKVKVVPDHQAEFPGGKEELSQYLSANFIARLPSSATGNIGFTSITFEVDENGRVITPKITQSSGKQEVDNLLLEAVAKMPAWKPATDARARKMRQTITLPFGGAGC